MLLKKIDLNNIRSYRNESIEFPLGSTLLSGDIGSGKTSVLLAIEFALFGLQPGQRGNSLLKNGEDRGSVKIVFEIGEREVVIERTLKRTKTVSQDYCAIIVDGEKREISVTELKDKVLELLNYPKEFAKKQNLLYKFTVYTPQEEMKQIILQDATTRINTLRHVFGIDKYKTVLENLTILVQKLREEKRIKQALTAELETDKLTLVDKINELETKHYNLSSVEKELFLKTENRKKSEDDIVEVSLKMDEKKNFEKEVEKTTLMISNKKDTITNNTKLLERIDLQIKELVDLKFDESKITELEHNVAKIKKQKIELNERNLDVSSKISSLNLKNQEAELTKQNLRDMDLCPTCLQDVESSYKANVFNKLDSDISQNVRVIEKLAIEKKTINADLEKLDQELVIIEKEITELKIIKSKVSELDERKKRKQEILGSIEMLNKDLVLLVGQKDNLKKTIFDLGKYEAIYIEKQKILQDMINEERTAEIKVAELKKEIEVFSNQIEELKTRIAKTEGEKKELDRLINLEIWLTKNFSPMISFVEKNVMVKLKSEFSLLFEKWFSMLVEENFNVSLRDDFTPVIEQQDYEIDYTYLSGGERTAVALAYRLALNQVINSLLSKIKTRDFVILDEPTDGFSDAQLDKMREVLDQLNVSQLIIVSHEQKIEGFVENVIKFKKEAGISKKM